MNGRVNEIRRLPRAWVAGAVLGLIAGAAGCAVTAAAQDVTLNLWINDDNSATRGLLSNKLIPEFEAAHPGIRVNIRWETWGKFNGDLITTFAAGASPDVYQPGAEWRGTLVAKDFVLPLDDYTRSWADKKDFFPAAWGSVSWHGHDYGVPYLTAPRSIIYRSDLFAASGLDPNKGPVTWDEVMEAATKLTRADNGRVTQLGLTIPTSNTSATQFWLPLLWQAGGTFVSTDGNKPTFNTDAGIEATQYMQQLYQTEYGRGAAPKGGLVDGAFVMQYAATSAVRGAITADPALKNVIKVAPAMSDKKQVAAAYTDWLAISSQSKHPKEAFQLIEWLVQPDNLAAYNATMFFIPGRESTISNPYVTDNPVIQQMLERVMPYATAYPSYNSANNLRLGAALVKVLKGTETPKAALAEAETGWVAMNQSVAQ